MTLAGVVVLGLLAIAALVAWNLLVFRRAPPAAGPTPPVSVLIPARNEAAEIGDAVRAACSQAVPDVEVVVLDDGSTDGTGDVLDRLAAELPRLRVVRGAALPGGWAGKAWACWQLAQQARHDWLLFVDADVRLQPDAVGRALLVARREAADFVSGFPAQRVASRGEALVVPLVPFLLLAYLPLALVRRTRWPALSAGCGQFMLVRRAAYSAAGGHEAVCGTLHDGVKLARRMKAAGFTIALFDGSDVAACRMYRGFGAAWRGFARNAYEALGSPLALLAMTALSGSLFVLPFLAIGVGWLAAGPGGVASLWLAAAGLGLLVRAAVAWRFGQPAWLVPALPVSLALMIAIQLHSYLIRLRGQPVEWRARVYPGAAPVGRR